MNTLKNKWFELFFFKGSGRLLYIVGIGLLISSVLGALTPLKITELASHYHDAPAFNQRLQFLAWLFIGIYCNRVVYQLSINRYILLLMQNVRTICYRKWLHIYDLQSNQKGASERYPRGEVVSRIMNDTESLRELMTSGTFGIFIDLFFVISCLGSFITLNRGLGLFLAGMEIIAVALLVWGSRYMREIFLAVRKSQGMMSRTLADVGGGLSQAYYTRHEHYAGKRGVRVFDDFLVKILRSNVWDAGYYSLAEGLYPLLLAMVVLIAPQSGVTQAAIIFAVVDLIQRSINPIKDISAKIANIQRAYSGIWRIQEFVGDLEQSPSSEGHTYKVLENFQTLKVDIPLFAYPQRQKETPPFQLQDITFEAHKGTLLGMVGPSGCGKSTLLGIIASNIIPTQGKIRLLYGGASSCEVNFPGDSLKGLAEYRQQVGLISQESHIFSESMAFNIGLVPQTTEELVQFWDWAKKQIPYLKSWGMELESWLEPKNLSQGQRQLVAALRSCFLKKPIVLFDEISSALDGELEAALSKAISIIQRNSLTLVVAHRLETVIKADYILVLHEGRIADFGHHRELLKKGQLYCQFLQELSLSRSE